MRRFVVVAAVLALAACRDKDADRLADIKVKMCACPTAACAEELMHTIPLREARSTPRTQQIAQQMLDCLAKLETARQPIADPDDEPGSAAPAPPSAAP